MATTIGFEMTVAVSSEREDLERFATLVEESSSKLLEALQSTPIPDDFQERWHHTASRLSKAIDRSTPPSLQPEQIAEIRGELLGIMQCVADADPDRPLDSVEAALLGLEAIRHLVRDVLDQQALGEGDARTLLSGLQETLPHIGRRELAQLLDTSERSIQRTLASRSPVAPKRRLVMVARLVSMLSHGWTPEGVLAWFHRSRPEMGGASVLGAIDDASLEREILELARHGRAQHGS
jgi:hypothetical protein